MRRWQLAVGLTGLLAFDPAAMVAQGASGVGVKALRFYRADTRQTVVKAFVEVPYSLLEAPAPGTSGDLKYGVVVTVADQGGTELYQAAWPGRDRADLQQAGASKLEILDFVVVPGTYRVTVTVTDSVSGRKLSTTTDVVGWSNPPKASDLMLSPSMRLATGDDTMPRLGEIRRGSTMVTPALELRLTLVRSKAYYLVEAYAETADSGTMRVQVADSAGASLVSTRPARVQIAPGGSVLKGQLDLAGLPGGQYTMSVTVVVAGDSVTRSERFEMAGLEETLKREQVRLETEKVTDEGYFGLMNGDQLDAAEAPLGYMSSSDSLKSYDKGLSLSAKRRFLITFWSARDPTPGTPRNEAREKFYRLIDEANQTYTEGGRSAKPGWKTDRGRIFVKFGEPLEKLDRRSSTGSSAPYQVWRYVQGREQYYIFADRTGFGGYQLIATNDLKETQRPGYREILGREALQDISRWLGIDLFREDAGRGVSPDF